MVVLACKLRIWEDLVKLFKNAVRICKNKFFKKKWFNCSLPQMVTRFMVLPASWTVMVTVHTKTQLWFTRKQPALDCGSAGET